MLLPDRKSMKKPSELSLVISRWEPKWVIEQLIRQSSIKCFSWYLKRRAVRGRLRLPNGTLLLRLAENSDRQSMDRHMEGLSHMHNYVSELTVTILRDQNRGMEARFKLETRLWKSASEYGYYFSTIKKNHIDRRNRHYTIVTMLHHPCESHTHYGMDIW